MTGEKNDAYFDNIHRYLSGDMTAAEREAFEASMNADTTLKADIELERQLLAAIALEGNRSAMRRTAEKLKEEGFFEKVYADVERPRALSVLYVRLRPILAVAAALTLLLSAYWFFLRPGPPDYDALFAQYHAKEAVSAQPYIEALTSSGMAPTADATAADSLRAALQLYADARYDASAAALDQFVQAHPDDETARLFLGLSQFRQQRLPEAIRAFTPLAAAGRDEVLTDEARWGLALCYLKTENGVAQAKALLEKLANKPNFNKRADARALLDRMQ